MKKQENKGKFTLISGIGLIRMQRKDKSDKGIQQICCAGQGKLCMVPWGGAEYQIKGICRFCSALSGADEADWSDSAVSRCSIAAHLIM